VFQGSGLRMSDPGSVFHSLAHVMWTRVGGLKISGLMDDDRGFRGLGFTISGLMDDDRGFRGLGFTISGLMDDDRGFRGLGFRI
jgi:hypothetical protein